MYMNDNKDSWILSSKIRHMEDRKGDIKMHN
jgi:hypothetical protein